MKMLFSIALLSILFFTSACGEEDEIHQEVIIENLLGTWEWDETSVNGISSSATPCCATLTFQSRDFSNLTGQFTILENGFTGVGSFEINLESNELITTVDTQERSFVFEMTETRLTLIYEENGDNVVDGFYKTN